MIKALGAQMMEVSGKIKIEYNNEEMFYNRDYLSTKAGQILLKKLYEKKEEVKISCLCKDVGLPMHMAKYGNGSKYTIRANNSKEHDENCSSGLTDAEYEKRVKRKHQSYNFEKDGKIYSFFNSNDYYENPIKEDSGSTPSKGKRTTQNVYSSMFGMGDNLLSNSWTNFVKTRGYIPKEGNLLYELYSDIDNYRIKGGLKLSDIMFVPYYKKNPELDITDMIKKRYSEIKDYLEGKELREGKMYILMKLGDENEICEQLESQRGQENIRIKISDPYKKGYFFVYCKASKFRREFNKHKVKDALYYISAFLSVKDDEVVIEKMATLPTMKGKGFYVESSKEIEFAEYLIEQEILFERPAKSSESEKARWNGWIPDFLILHPKTREVTRVAEVFGFKDFWEEKEYKEKMESKIKFFTSIQGEIIEEFIYWKANEGWNMPRLQKKTGKFLGIKV